MNSSGAASRLWDRVFERVRRELGDAPGCHDFAHTLRVLKNAERIAAEEPGCDPDAVRFGALLHDVARPEELASGGKLCHAELGAEKSRRILEEEGCENAAFVRHVSEIVRMHRYRGNRKPATLEARIVYDADKLDSLGAFGVARAFHFAGRIGACLHNTEEEALASESYSSQDSAYREYLVKLRGLPDHLLTDSARRFAADRAAFMKAFFERLNEEQEGRR
ncbi:MAG: HD domain-containing protein [Lentisphaeria bacterium]|nr:HD domain-containing protein [Lentisphaeria bacterium]